MRAQAATRRNPNVWELHHGAAWVVVPTSGQTDRRGFAIMGKGLALQASRRFPGLRAHLGVRLRRANRVFRFPQWKVFTFPVRERADDPADLALIERSAIQLRKAIQGEDACPVLMPRVGTGGPGRLPWIAVKPVLERELGNAVTYVKPAVPASRPPAPARTRRRGNPPPEAVPEWEAALEGLRAVPHMGMPGAYEQERDAALFQLQQVIINESRAVAQELHDAWVPLGAPEVLRSADQAELERLVLSVVRGVGNVLAGGDPAGLAERIDDAYEQLETRASPALAAVLDTIEAASLWRAHAVAFVQWLAQVLPDNMVAMARGSGDFPGFLAAFPEAEDWLARRGLDADALEVMLLMQLVQDFPTVYEIDFPEVTA